jgi:hypothetical protein
MKNTEITNGKTFWHNGRHFTATSVFEPKDGAVVVWTVNEDGKSEALRLQADGYVLEAIRNNS